MKTRRFILLTAVVAALAIGLVIVMGVRLDRVTEEEIVTRFSQHQLLLAEQTAAAIQSVFDKAQQYLLHFKDAPGPSHLTDALAMEDEEGIATWRGVTGQSFSSCLRSHPTYTQIRYIDAGGQEIVVINRDGETVRLVPQDELRLQAEREFFIATQQLDEGEIYVSPLEPALGHGETGAGLLAVRLATPVFDSQGRRQGIIVINLLADEIRAHIARLSAEEGVDAWMLDETGVETINVTHPEWEGSNAYEYCQQTGDKILIAVAEDMLAGGRGTGVYLWPEEMDGPPVVKRLAAYTPIHPAEGQVWSVGTSVPYDTILAAHRQTHRTLFLLGESIVAIIVLAAILAAQSIRKQAVTKERGRLNQVLSRRVEELAFLNETAHTLTSSLDQQEVLTSLLHRATAMLKAEIGSICLREEDGHLRFAVAVGSHAEQIQGQRLPSDEGVVGWCIREGQPILVPDVREDARFYSGVDEESGFVTRSILCLPLRVRDETIGALEILNKTGGFDQDDLQLMESVTAQAAIAIENARLYQAEQAARERADTLRETSRVVGSTLELDDVLSLVLRQTKRVLAYDTASILLFANDEPAMAAVAGYENEELVKTETSMRLGDSSILQTMARDHQAIVIADVREDERWTWIPGTEHIRAWIGAPLLVRDEMIGALMLDSTQPGSYTAVDAATVQALANQVAVAVENARLYKETQHRLESLTNLNRASQAIASSLDVKDVLEQIVDLAGSVVNSDYISVVLLDEKGEPVLGAENLRGVSPITWRIRRSGGITRHVLDNRQPVVVDAISDDGAISPPLRRPDGELIEANPDIVAAGIRSFAAVPIQVKKKILGVVFAHSRRPCAFHGQLSLLTTFANQAAVAIENARLYEETRRHAEELAVLHNIDIAITSTLNLDEVLNLIARQAAELMDAETIAIPLLDEDGTHLTYVTVHGRLAADLTGRVKPLRDTGICTWVLRNKQGFYSADLAADERETEGTRELLGIQTVISAPMIFKGEISGAITAVNKRDGGLFTRDDLEERLQPLANQAVIAIENARLFQAEQEQRELAEALEEAAAAVSSTLDADQVLDSILEQVERVVTGDTFNITLIEDDIGRIVRCRGRSQSGTRDKISRPAITIAEYPNLVKMMQTGEPVLIPDTASDPNWVPSKDWDWRRSYVAAPIQAGGVTMGFLNVSGAQAGQFGPADARRLEAFADHAATAIENARLFEAEQRRSAELQALYNTSLRMGRQPETFEELLHLIVEQAITLLGVETGGFYLYNPLRDELTFSVTVGYFTEFVGTTIKPGEGLAGKVFTSRRPLAIEDYHTWTGRAAIYEGESRFRAILGVPLLGAEGVLGVLDVGGGKYKQAFDEHDVRLAELFAAQAAVAVENAHLFEAEQRRRQEAETLRQTALALTTSLDRNQVIERILIQLRQVVPYDSASVQLLRGDRLEIVGGHGFPNLPDMLGLSFPVDGNNPNSEVVHTRSPFIVADGPAVYEEFRREPHAQAGIRSWLGVPMLVGEQLVGMIALDKREPGFYTQEHAQLALAFAAQAAIAFENARLYEQAQQEIAERKRAQEALDQRLIALTQPVGEMGELKLTDIMDVRILQELQDRFAASYDVASLIFDDEGEPITEPSNFSDFCKIIRATQKGMERCEISDARLAHLVTDGSSAVVPCKNFAAIQDGAVPIFVGGRHVATWAIGQKLTGELVEEEVRGYAEEIGADADQLVAAGKKLKVGSKEQFERAISFLETMASNVSLLGLQNIQQAREITERKRAEKALERRATQLATLSEVGRQIASVLELEPLLDHVVNLIREAFDYRHVSVLLIDPATGELALEAGAGYEMELARALHLRVGEEGICGWVAASGEPLLVGDVSQEPRYYPALPDTRSELVVPIQVKNQVIGVLDVQSTELDAFDEDDLFTLRTLADQVGVAIENAGLYQELRNHAGQLEQRVQERTAQLEAQYARLDAILRSATDGIIVTDAGGEIVQTNPVAQTWLTKTLSPEDAARLRETARDLAQRAEERPETVLELTGLDLQLNAAPISEPQPTPPSASGGLGGVAVVGIHDVSHLKALDRMKSRFVSNVSHELRTPVTTIKLYAYLMQKRPDKLKQYIDALEQVANQQAQLVEDILQVSRIDAGRLEMKLQPTALNELTEMSVGNQQRIAQEQGLTLEHRPAEPGPVALIDPQQIMQVLCNMVTNAIHYTPEGGRVIVSTGKEQVEDRTWATVTVADTGIGIPEKELPHIFERFFRGEEPQLMQSPGTGLGLAIVNEIVELHGGRVTVESKVGEGSTFTVWLPLAD